jgi:hypothetical protein
MQLSSQMGQKVSFYFVRYSREFVITVIVNFDSFLLLYIHLNQSINVYSIRMNNLLSLKEIILIKFLFLDIPKAESNLSRIISQ